MIAASVLRKNCYQCRSCKKLKNKNKIKIWIKIKINYDNIKIVTLKGRFEQSKILRIISFLHLCRKKARLVHSKLIFSKIRLLLFLVLWG